MLFFKLDWRQSFIEAVAPFRTVEHLDVVEDVLPSLIRVAYTLRRARSRFSNWKKVSATALS